MKILHLSKENLKFSAAHFLIFDASSAERLHGHNYRVQMDFFWQAVPDPNLGFCVEFRELKELIYRELDNWDERVLLPHQCLDMKFKENGKTIEVQFRDRFYAFPREEVILLPIVNTSVELLSEILGGKIWSTQSKFGFHGLKIYIEETPGQGAFSLFGEKF
jgi:6-pyruvoyltetrahydropterin/6-carboxytetrahydropterin synthase